MATPQSFFDELNNEFNFTLDPCATKENAKCNKFYTKEQDGLKQDWSGERVFCNPPYGKVIGDWVRKCYEESKKSNTTVVALIPARTDTRYFHEYIYCVQQNGALPTLATAKVIAANIKAINEAMLAIGGSVVCGWLWTSTVKKSNNCAFVVHASYGNVFYDYHNYDYYAVRFPLFILKNFIFNLKKIDYGENDFHSRGK